MKALVSITCLFVIAAASFYFYSSYAEAQRVARVTEGERFARYFSHCRSVFDEKFVPDEQKAKDDYASYRLVIKSYYDDLNSRKERCSGYYEATEAPSWFK